MKKAMQKLRTWSIAIGSLVVLVPILAIVFYFILKLAFGAIIKE